MALKCTELSLVNEKTLGADAMERVPTATRAYLRSPWLFEPVKRPDDRTLAAVSSPVQAPGTHFYTLGGVGPYIYGRTLVRARPNDYSQRTGLSSQRTQVIMSEFIEQGKLPSRIGKSELPNWNGEYFKNVNRCFNAISIR